MIQMRQDLVYYVVQKLYSKAVLVVMFSDLVYKIINFVKSLLSTIEHAYNVIDAILKSSFHLTCLAVVVLGWFKV